MESTYGLEMEAGGREKKTHQHGTGPGRERETVGRLAESGLHVVDQSVSQSVGRDRSEPRLSY